jgi:signal transduction histidine kinase
VTAERSDEHIRLVVTDEGTGFPPEFVDKAFDRFSRAETSRTTGRTGLALSPVQAVAEAHHGNRRHHRTRHGDLTLPNPDENDAATQ